MVVVACFGQVCAGCGQDNPDDFDFALRSLNFEVSNASPQWRQAPVSIVPNMVCAGPLALVTDCCSPPPPAAPFDCQQYPVACDPVDNFCALTFDVEQEIRVNLVADVPELAAADGRVFSAVWLTSLGATVKGLDDLPMRSAIRSARLYVGPAGMGSSSNPAATLLAQVSLTEGTSQLSLGDDAQQAFSAFGRDYRAPFSFLLSTHLVIPNGTSPDAKVTFVIEARAEAWY